jgi:hypothetical protein
MSRRYFTVEEARAVLPQVRDLIEKAIPVLNRMHRCSPDVRRLAENAALNTGGPAGAEYLECLILVSGYVGRIQSMGCLVKSLEDGLVDFPCRKDGREVYLCWRYGEKDIEYWHEVDAGFAGRVLLGEND